MNPWKRFLNVAKYKKTDYVPVALLGTPRFFASFAGVELFECLYNPQKLMEVELQAFKRFPDHYRIREYFKNYIMVFHCDTRADHVIGLVGQTGIDVFNIGPTTDLAQALSQIGDHCCIMGNLCPVKVMQSGNHDKVKIVARECIASSGNGKGFILSAGGGLNENTPPENIDSLVEVSQTKLNKKGENIHTRLDKELL